MNEFIYPIAHIFSSANLLQELNATQYYIASYQRGYKWKSFGKNDQVPILLTDIYEAFSTNANEYYLQYITVKKNAENADFLEVIDGQQRLTTLSLLFYVAEKHHSIENCAKGKVVYQRYKTNNEFQDIFEHILSLNKSDSSLDNQQDIYYLYHAKECIKEFFSILGEELKPYITYLLNHVKIIVNLEDELTSAEEVFSNLNDNKVDLTNYYLIKGLLFTQSTRSPQSSHSFLEIQAKRNRLARNWDHLNQWFLNEKHNQLFFYNYKILNEKEKNIGINSILNLTKPKKSEKIDEPRIRNFIEKIENNKDHQSKEIKTSVNEMELFNLYLDHLKTSEKAENKLEELQNVAKRMMNWYADDELYHLIGYYVATKNSIEILTNKGKSDLKKVLYKHLYDSLQLGKDRAISSLEYGPDNAILNRIFLALNAFPLVYVNGEATINFKNHFSFYDFTKNNWSIEHIYPQNPNVSVADVIKYKNWFLEKTSDETLKNEIESVTIDEKKVPDTIQQLIMLEDVSEHYIGNLALLEKGNNSTLSNNIFPKKRELLLTMLAKGNFVPQHTINAVSKNLHWIEEDNENYHFTPNLTNWQLQDMQANASWIEKTYNLLMELIKQKL
ncbi:DUF262 domain-containing protein [Paenimyroides tangerinum]|uniref:DUF262 domain-containing protein n=1 Tax=Paenimyroides tangerinum TaxID=2488728 RepID=A0A3P3VY23_9FLAO|nr:DUF262 domain-containing protein [Paenimyroides tangerinum]RRJ86928.1 DUF262 domain-containing protein [Paenimyroides tangerinum]